MADAQLSHQARCLLRAARAGTLATMADGQPFASLVTPACAPDLGILLLLSALAAHTRQLRAAPQCCVMVAGPAPEANPQTAPRISVSGAAEPIADPALKARWLTIHPYAALYADFGDFTLWRIRPDRALLVGGFGRAARLRAADLQPDPAAVAALATAEADLLAHCNTTHADTLATLAGTPGPWRMVAADVDGCDLAQTETVRRIPWPAPVRNAEEALEALKRLSSA